jgi:hypothetical protein
VMRGEALRLATIGFGAMAMEMANTAPAAALSRAKSYGRLLEQLRTGCAHGSEPLRRQATRALMELLSALATAEVQAAEAARGAGAPPSYVLVDAAFATSRSALAPEKPWDHRLTEEDALCILLGHPRGVLKPKQRQALDAWQQGRDAVVLLPTGGGKSATFLFMPALRSAGGGLVVQPLRALMRSMVEHVLPEGVGTAAAVHGRAGALLRYAAGAAHSNTSWRPKPS